MKNYQGSALDDQIKREERRKTIRNYAIGFGTLTALIVGSVSLHPKEYKGEWMTYTVSPSIANPSPEDSLGIYHLYGIPLREAAERIVLEQKYTNGKKGKEASEDYWTDVICNNPENAWKGSIHPLEEILVPKVTHGTTDVKRHNNVF